MPRIRSVHPGLFTDEAFAQLSADAQIFFVGLWTEADDQGVFEWKPHTLRMRLRPCRDGSVDPILAELAGVNCILEFESDGKHYGAIRNFCKWQRPKKPNAIHPAPPAIAEYTGLSAKQNQQVKPSQFGTSSVPVGNQFGTSSEPVRNQFGTSGEIVPQMEDGGWRMEDERDNMEDVFKGGVGGKPIAPCGASPPDGGAQNHPDDLFDGDCGASKIDAMPVNIAPGGVWPGSIGNDTSCQPMPASGGENGHKIDSGRKQRKAKINRQSRIDPGWEITEGDGNHMYAQKVGMTWAEMEAEEARFKNYHEARGSLMADWNAAWRTWCGNWAKYRQVRN